MINCHIQYKYPLLILILSAYFCHKLFGYSFAFEGDATNNIYMWFHANYLATGYDPYIRDYFPSLSVFGNSNPIFVFWKFFIGVFNFPPVMEAMIGNMSFAFIQLVCVQLSVFYFLRLLGRTNPASLLGSIISTYTGFQLVGVREFDFFYLQSYWCAVWAIYFSAKLTVDSQYRLPAFIGLIFFTQLSLLSGGNTPFFFYAPLFLVMPLATAFMGQRLSECLLRATLISLGLLLGVLLSPSVIFNSIEMLKFLNRDKPTFLDGIVSFTIHPMEILKSGIFRDWYLGPFFDMHYHERDFFLGMPALALAIIGILLIIFNRHPNSLGDINKKIILSKIVEKYYLFCCAIAIAILFTRLYPIWIQELISSAASFLSFRNPYRFGMLLLLPVGYFSALAFDLRPKFAVFIVLIAVLIYVALAVDISTSVGWVSYQEVSDQMLISLSFSIVSLLLIFFYSKNDKNKKIGLALISCVYFSFAFAIQPETAYSKNYFSNIFYRERVADQFPLKDMASRFGFSFDYKRSYELLVKRLTIPPPYLDGYLINIKSIFDPHEFPPFWKSYYSADNVQIKDALAYIHDPATPRLMKNLFENRNEDILNMMGIDGELTYTSQPLERIDLAYLRLSSLPINLPIVKMRDRALGQIRYVKDLVIVDSQEKELSDLKLSSTNYLRDHIFTSEQGVEISNKDSMASALGQTPEIKTQFQDGKISTTIKNGSAGYIFYAIPYMPQWKATHDGKRLPIIRANYAFMAIPVTKELNHIELSFERTLYQELRYFSWFALAVLMVAFMVTSRRQTT